MTNLNIYTDGACSQGVKTTMAGGWGVYIQYDNEEFRLKGGAFNTTNNIMELTALLNALRFIRDFKKPYDHVNIYIDSAYTINCINQKWYVKWRLNGWRTASKDPVKNKELWEEILDLYDSLDAAKITFSKVSAHGINVGNNIADLLAVEEKIKYMEAVILEAQKDTYTK